MNFYAHHGYSSRKFVFLSLILLALYVVGCRTSAVFWDDHRAYPKQPRFTIIPCAYSAQELKAAGIRTDGVYVDIGWRPLELQSREEAEMKEKGWKTGSPFYRFWANGRVMSRLPKVDDMTAHHADSFERARMGYFRVVQNDVIEVELFTYDPGKWDYSYLKVRLSAEGETLWKEYGYNQKHKGETVKLGYRFVHIPEMQAQPDW